MLAQVLTAGHAQQVQKCVGFAGCILPGQFFAETLALSGPAAEPMSHRLDGRITYVNVDLICEGGNQVREAVNSTETKYSQVSASRGFGGIQRLSDHGPRRAVGSQLASQRA